MLKIESGFFTCTIPGFEPIFLSESDEGPDALVSIWKDECRAIDQREMVARSFTDFLDTSCRLFYSRRRIRVLLRSAGNL